MRRPLASQSGPEFIAIIQGREELALAHRDSVLTRGMENGSSPSPLPRGDNTASERRAAQDQVQAQTTDRVPVAAVGEETSLVCKWREGDSGQSQAFRGGGERGTARQTVGGGRSVPGRGSKSSRAVVAGVNPEFSEHHCSSSKQVAESRVVYPSWERSSSESQRRVVPPQIPTLRRQVGVGQSYG